MFCLRGVGETLAALATRCARSPPESAAPGRRLDEVSFINATGLVLRVSIRRRGQPPLAFFDRPEWLRSWFPGYDGQVLDLCRRLNALLEALRSGASKGPPCPPRSARSRETRGALDMARRRAAMSSRSADSGAPHVPIPDAAHAG